MTDLSRLLAANQFSGVVLQAVGDEIMLARGHGLADRALEAGMGQHETGS
jgi:hypothetical protein